MEVTYSYDVFTFPHLEDVMKRYGEFLAQRLKDNLAEDGSNTSESSLSNSIEFILDKGENEISVSISLLEYWKWLNAGTKPHFPPLKAIEKWIQIKPITPEVRNGKLPTVKQLAFLIGRAMAGLSPNQANCKNPNGGTTGTHFFDKAQKDAMAEFEDALQEAINKDLEDAGDALLVPLLMLK